MAPRDGRPGAEDGEADHARRTLIRGVAVAGLAGLAGFPLSGCGEDTVDPAARAAGAPQPLPATPTTAAPAAPASSARPKSAATSSSTPTSRPAAKAAKQEKADKDTSAAGPDAEPEPTRRPAEKPTAKAKPAAEPATRAPKGAPIAGTEEIPVGSGTLYEGQGLIVTQPVAGDYRAFSCFCTHEGCVIDVFEGQTMVCTCHGSTFRITDGKPTSGPARRPVPKKPIVVADGKIYRT